MDLIISLEGFSLKHQYIIKELTVMKMNGHYEHFLFSAPQMNITHQDRVTIQYTERNISGLLWSDGTLSYSSLIDILGKAATAANGGRIYCHGNMAREFLASRLPSTTCLVDSSQAGKKFPKRQQGGLCGKIHNGRYCSLAKAMFILDNFV